MEFPVSFTTRTTIREREQAFAIPHPEHTYTPHVSSGVVLPDWAEVHIAIDLLTKDYLTSLRRRLGYDFKVTIYRYKGSLYTHTISFEELPTGPYTARLEPLGNDAHPYIASCYNDAIDLVHNNRGRYSKLTVIYSDTANAVDHRGFIHEGAIFDFRDSIIKWGIFTYAQDFKHKTDCEILRSSVHHHHTLDFSHTLHFEAAHKRGFRDKILDSPRCIEEDINFTLNFTEQ
jgi:hypothetical protein